MISLTRAQGIAAATHQAATAQLIAALKRLRYERIHAVNGSAEWQRDYEQAVAVRCALNLRLDLERDAVQP